MNPSGQQTSFCMDQVFDEDMSLEETFRGCFGELLSSVVAGRNGSIGPCLMISHTFAGLFVQYGHADTDKQSLIVCGYFAIFPKSFDMT